MSPVRPQRLAVVAGLVALLVASPARAGLRELEDCLDRFHLECAVKERARLGGAEAQRADLWIAVHRGDYGAVARLVEAGAAGAGPDEGEAPYRATVESARGMVEQGGAGVAVRYAPGLDAILAEEAVETLVASRAAYDALFGGGPAHDIVLDIFPTATRFIGASGLPPESVRTTGVIALSKWTRLLLTSPRALSRGYAWKDTVAHEYIHLVVAYRTGNRAPVWLQEGLAKHLEGRWRGDRSGRLGAHTESLLAKAVQTGEFVPFAKFARSMAYLDSGEEAALAFGQVATMVQLLIERAGPDALPVLMDRVAGGDDPMQVFAELAGQPSFEAFRLSWVAWLRTQPLVAQQLATLPVVLDGGGDETASDPLLAGRPDLQRFYRLGDLLREAGHPRAALVEYAKAIDPSTPTSPLLLARQADCYEALREPGRALQLVDEGLGMYPEHALLQKTRGRLLMAQGDPSALGAFRAAHDLNPYDIDVQRALTTLYGRAGKAEAAARHLRYVRLLETGGAVAGASASSPR
jgi:tetratricopeptide (TPR) repeat protein